MFYTVTDIARILGVSLSLVKLRAKEGKLIHYKREGNKDTKYYTKEEIERFANECGYKIDELEWLTRDEMKGVILKQKETIKSLQPSDWDDGMDIYNEM